MTHVHRESNKDCMRCRGKIDILFISEAVDWSGAPKMTMDFIFNPLATHEQTIRANEKVGLGRRAADSRIVCFPAKRVTFLSIGSLRSPSWIMEKPGAMESISSINDQAANF